MATGVRRAEGVTPNPNPEPDPEWIELVHDGIEGTHRIPNNERSIAHWTNPSRGWKRAESATAPSTSGDVTTGKEV